MRTCITCVSRLNYIRFTGKEKIYPAVKHSRVMDDIISFSLGLIWACFKKKWEHSYKQYSLLCHNYRVKQNLLIFCLLYILLRTFCYTSLSENFRNYKLGLRSLNNSHRHICQFKNLGGCYFFAKFVLVVDLWWSLLV